MENELILNFGEEDSAPISQNNNSRKSKDDNKETYHQVNKQVQKQNEKLSIREQR